MEDEKKELEEIDNDEDIDTEEEKEPAFKNGIMLNIVIIVGAIGIMLLSKLPALQELRDSLTYDIIIRVLLFLTPLYFTWIHSSKPEPAIAKIISTAVAFTAWLPMLIEDSQVLIMIDIVCFFVLLGYALYIYLAKKATFKVINYEAIFFVLSMLSLLGDYTFLNNSGSLHFWQASLIFAIVASIISFVLLKKGIIALKDDRKSEKVAVVVLVFFAAFVISWITACNLNYALDKNEPTEYMAVIENKDVETSGKSFDRYEFILTFDGKTIELDVSQTEYYAYEIGDNFPIKLYQGAFNDPYYISGNR